jgi:hypothetical protein
VSTLRTFIVPVNAREGFFEADVATFYGTTASPKGIAILTLCDGKPESSAVRSGLLGPDGQPQLSAPKKLGSQKWRYVVALEGEAPPVSLGGPTVLMQPIGGVWAGMGGVWVFVERIA